MVEPERLHARHRRHPERQGQRARHDAASGARLRSAHRRSPWTWCLQVDARGGARMTATAPSRVLPRPGDPAITPALVAEHGLTEFEYQKLVDMLGRTP